MVDQALEKHGGDDGIAEHLAPSAKPQFSVTIMAPFS